jgi:tetratricopeptide (TPR) repeat protein
MGDADKRDRPFLFGKIHGKIEANLMEGAPSRCLIIKEEGMLGIFLLLSSFSFYLWHLSPSLYWRDPGEFAAIGYTLSVGHPTGMPTYSLIGKFFTLLPWGSIFQKINLVSAVFGSLSVFLGYHFVLRLTQYQTQAFSKNQFWPLFAAAGAGLLLMVSPTFWLYSMVAKGYPQVTFWIIVLFLLLWRFREEGRKSPASRELPETSQSFFWAAAFIFGLSLGTYGAIILYLPAFLAFCFLADRRWYREPKVLFLGIFFFLVGFSVYLYLPIRSSTNPFLDWGEPRTLSRFLNHLMDAKDSQHNVSFPWFSLPDLAWESFKVLSDQFTPFGILLAVLGAAMLFRKDRPFFWLTFGIAFIHWSFFVRLWEMSFLYIPLYLIFAIWIGLGIFHLAWVIEASWKRGARAVFRKGLAWALGCGVAATFVFQLILHQPTSGKNEYYVPYAVGKELLLSLPPRTLLFSYYTTMLLHGMQSVENCRPDVFVAVIFPLRSPHLYWNLDAAHYPVFDFDKLQGVIYPNSIDFFDRLFAVHFSKYPLYWDLAAEDHWLTSRLLPEKLYYRVQEKDTPLDPELRRRNLQESFQFYQSLFSLTGVEADEEGRRFLKNLMAIKGVYYFNRGELPAAFSCTRVALGLMPGDSSLYTNQALLQLSMGKKEEALKSWNRALKLNPREATSLINRAAFYYREKKVAEALADWEAATRLEGEGIFAYYYRGMAYREMGKPKEALADLQTFMKKSDRLVFYFYDNPVFKEAKMVIQELSTGPIGGPAPEIGKQ